MLLQQRVDTHFHSRFGGLWVDRTDSVNIARQMLDQTQITSAEYVDLCAFINDGYLIFHNAVSDDLIVAFETDVQKVYSGDIPRQMSFWNKDGHNVVPASRDYINETECKLLDLHWASGAAQDLIFARRVRRFLEIVLARPALAFQSLYFHRGSQQSIHQDTAFVPVAGAPLEFVASWIALEDVVPGSGELLYVPRSHRLADLTFTAGNKKCPPDDPLIGRYAEIVKGWYESAGLKPQAFLPRRGSVLFWAADLAHGGAPITKAGVTRRSMVTHYCPLSRRPEYAAQGVHEIKQTRSGGYVIGN